MSNHGKYAETRPQSAPLGVKIIAALGIIGGILGLVGSVGFTAFGGLAGVVLGLFFAAFSVVVIVVNASLLSLKRWAWKAAIALNGLGAVLDLLTLEVLGMVISLVVLVYLYSKEEYFYK